MDREGESVEERLKMDTALVVSRRRGYHACRFSDEEIVIDRKHMNAECKEEVWISIPVDALSKTDSGVVYYDPSQLRDTIKQALTQDKRKKVETGGGK